MRITEWDAAINRCAPAALNRGTHRKETPMTRRTIHDRAPRALPRLALLLALAAASGCATSTGGAVVTPWGAAGLHRFDGGVERLTTAREAPLPTLDNPLLSRSGLAANP
jgi:hypothetical protein